MDCDESHQISIYQLIVGRNDHNGYWLFIVHFPKAQRAENQRGFIKQIDACKIARKICYRKTKDFENSPALISQV